MQNDNYESGNGRQSRNMLIVILVISILVLLAALGVLGSRLYFELKSQQTEEMIQDIAEPAEPVVTEEEEEEEIILPDNPIDFEALKAVNDEIYAWIRIDDTMIDYPVLQSREDDDYYLSHDADRNYSPDGSIYSQLYNSTDFSDPVTVLYGHNLRSGRMFQNLHKFENQSFFDEIERFHVYLPGHDLTYRIFAIINYDDTHLMKKFDFSDEAVFMDFVDSIFNYYRYSGHVRDEVEINKDNRILILSTCVAGEPDQRCLVTAVLEDDQETN